jgi:hypothetical protein
VIFLFNPTKATNHGKYNPSLRAIDADSLWRAYWFYADINSVLLYLGY